MSTSGRGGTGWRLWWLAPALVVVLLAVWFGRGLIPVDVYVVNGLDVPVTVTLDDETFTVAPNARADRSRKVGKHHIEAKTAAGAPLGGDDVDLVKGTSLALYNVAGAAPLFSAVIAYSASVSESNNASSFDSHVGKRWVVSDHGVDYLFTQPPESLSVSDGRTTRRSVILVSPGGWRSSAGWLLEHKRADEASLLATRMVLLTPENDDSYQTAASVAMMAHGAEGMLELGKQLIAARPDSIEAHRMYQTGMDFTGRGDECLAEYRRRYAAAPTAASAYLQVRMERGDRAFKMWQELTARFPDSPHLHRGLGWELLVRHRYGEALVDLERSAALQPTGAEELLEPRAKALIGLGRAREALALIESHAAGQTTLDYHLAMLYARVSRIADPNAASERFFSAHDALRHTALVSDQELTDAALLGTKPTEAAALMIDSVLPRDVERGLALIRAAPPETFTRLDGDVLLLAAAELQRRGDGSLSERLLNEGPPIQNQLRIKRLVKNMTGSLEELLPEQRAALLLVRARNTRNAAERDKLYAAIPDEDLLRGPITRALARWPRGEGPPPPTAAMPVNKDVLREVLKAQH